MDRDGGGTQRPAAVTDAPSPSLSPPPIDEETLWQMNLRAGEFMEPGPFPERPGEPVCAYYTRTGFCRFGMACRFNHPPDGNLAVGAARTKGGYPERVGQPECQYYLKTGTCKFGATCKFHHPRDMAGVPGRATLNIIGYPLRPNEMECAYYLRTGHCKFGNTCKFHHPQPSNSMVTVHGSSVYSPIHSSTPGQQSYLGGPSNWPLSRASLISSPRWQGSSYPQLMPSQGLVQVPSWNSYPRENVFPERPDQPECQFYMKTGDCKFGALCRFHHPKEWLIPAPNCALSPLRLPLRPGEPLCIFYSRYGICKFGPNCKFDHPMAMPMGFFAYNLSSSSAHAPVIQGLSGSTLPPLGSTEPGLASPRQSSHPESRQMNYGDGNIEVEDSHATASTGQGSSPA